MRDRGVMDGRIPVPLEERRIQIRVGPAPQRYLSAGLEQPPGEALPEWPEG
jgi:hypothetical protein